MHGSGLGDHDQQRIQLGQRFRHPGQPPVAAPCVHGRHPDRAMRANIVDGDDVGADCGVQLGKRQAGLRGRLAVAEVAGQFGQQLGVGGAEQPLDLAPPGWLGLCLTRARSVTTSQCGASSYSLGPACMTRPTQGASCSSTSSRRSPSLRQTWCQASVASRWAVTTIPCTAGTGEGSAARAGVASRTRAARTRVRMGRSLDCRPCRQAIG